MRGRELHEHILVQIERRLGGRSWQWLAQVSGVPRTTLVTQAARPKFSVEIVFRVANALDVEVADLFPGTGQEPVGIASELTRSEIIGRIEGYLNLLRELEAE